MPRATWRGFLRLSLVTCPVYLSPATTRTKPIRLHQVWQPASVDVDEDELPDRSSEQQGSASSAPRLLAENGSPDEGRAATRIALRPHDPGTGEEIDAPLASSAAKARASVIGATGFWVRGLVIVLQIRSSGIPMAFISLT
jgi:hypothetical protein